MLKLIFSLLHLHNVLYRHIFHFNALPRQYQQLHIVEICFYGYCMNIYLKSFGGNVIYLK